MSSSSMSNPQLARKYTYDTAADRWDEADVHLRIASTPFSEGGMRLAYRAREMLADGSEVDCVVKQMKSSLGVSSDVNFDEAMTQTVAESYAQDFNRECAKRGLGHSLAFLPVSVVQVEGSSQVLCLEPYLPGEYVKHNDNAGHNETEDEVAAAFSYFTYITSNKLLVVCDIQGVGTFYTDPQIHTFDGERFGAGNLGLEGIERFLASHRHSLLCEQLGLPSQDEGLTDEELARKIQDAERRDSADQMAMAQMAMGHMDPMGHFGAGHDPGMGLHGLLGNRPAFQMDAPGVHGAMRYHQQQMSHGGGIPSEFFQLHDQMLRRMSSGSSPGRR